MLVLVTGATGFLGRHVVRELVAHHHDVLCLVHSPGKERVFSSLDVEVHYGSILDRESLTQALYGVQAVVHLVGIIRPTRRASFDQVHRQGTANIAEAAKESGVREIVYVSAMGATLDSKYPYLYSKYQGEIRVINSGLNYTILRPSVIFGQGDEFLTALAGLVRMGPVAPVVGSGKNRMQPVAVEDVARCIAVSVGNSMVKGRTFNLGGPQRLSYNEILEEVAIAMGKELRRVHIPTPLAYPAAAFLQAFLPRPPVTTGQLRMLAIRNVAEGRDIQKTFGFTPRPMRGNIDYVNSVGFGDAVKMNLGLAMPRRS